MTPITCRCSACGDTVPLATVTWVGDLPRCRRCAPPDWKTPEAHRPSPDETGREALDAPQQEFEPGETPR